MVGACAFDAAPEVIGVKSNIFTNSATQGSYLGAAAGVICFRGTQTVKDISEDFQLSILGD